MRQDKNIIKGDKFAEQRVVAEKAFYAIVELKVKQLVEGKMTTVSKDVLLDFVGSRIIAKRELEREAKRAGGKVKYFGGFNN